MHTLGDAVRLCISIHAPVKGATLQVSFCLVLYYISIHAPVKGATSRPADPHVLTANFNPRSREGSDPIKGWLYVEANNFNPRSREGSDAEIPRVHGCGKKFQSTLP